MLTTRVPQGVRWLVGLYNIKVNAILGMAWCLTAPNPAQRFAEEAGVSLVGNAWDHCLWALLNHRQLMVNR